MRVPLYERQAPVTSAMPNVRLDAGTDPTAFGVGVGKAVQEFGESLEKTANLLEARAQELKQEQDTNTVLDISNKWSTDINSYLYDPEKGAMNKRGSEARGLTAEAAAKIEEINNKYLGQLQNDDQRLAFKKYTNGRVQTTVEGISKHEADQMYAWKQESKEGTKVVTIDNIKQKYQDPNAVYAEIDAGIKAIDAQSKGHAPEAVMAEKRQYVNDAHVAVVNQFIAKEDYRSARTWFEKHKSEFVAPEEVETSLTKSEQIGEAQTLSKQLITKYGIDNESGAMAEVDSLYPAGPKREKMRDYVRGEFGYARQQDNLAEANNFNRALIAIHGAKSYDEVQQIISNSGLKKAEHILSLETAAKSKLGIDPETGRPKSTPIGVYIQALTEFEGGVIPDMNHFLMRYGQYMSDADLKKFSEKILNGDSGVGWMSLIKDIAPKVKEKDIPLVLDTVEGMEKQFKLDNKRAPDTAERGKMVQDAMADIILADGKLGRRYEADMPPGTYWDDSRKMFVVESDGQLFQVKPRTRE